MSVHTIEEVSPTRRKFKITIPADDVQKSWNKVVQETQNSAEVRGFRKGKAPLSLIKAVYAQDITKKVVNTLVNDAYSQVAKESKLQIINKPTIEPETQFAENVDFSFSATVDIYTQTEIKDYKELSISLPSKLSPTAEQEEIEKVLKEQSTCTHDHSHDHAHDEHEHVHTEACNHDHAHEEHEHVHTEACNHDHAHEEAPTSHVHELSAEQSQKINEEMHSYFDQMRARSAYEQVVDQLLAKNSFEVADALVESMIDQLVYNNEVVRNKKDPKTVSQDKSLREQYRDQAVKQVKAIVALTQIAQQENIVVPFSEITKSVAYFLETNRWNFQQIRENQAALVQEHKNELTLLKTINFILKNANITWNS